MADFGFGHRMKKDTFGLGSPEKEKVRVSLADSNLQGKIQNLCRERLKKRRYQQLCEWISMSEA